MIWDVSPTTRANHPLLTNWMISRRRSRPPKKLAEARALSQSNVFLRSQRREPDRRTPHQR